MTIKSLILISISTGLFLIGCKIDANKNPFISFDKYTVADGFEIQLAASEPLTEAPVAMDFDNQGRMWVVEMRGFMPNLAGIGDTAPNGRITILEDRDGDGIADHSKVFLDSLVLPRAIALVYGGLLYAVPPNLWFAKIKSNDRPGESILVDSSYAEGGNPEAQANGLMMGIDNWIYSANSQFRYQFKDEKWIKEPTSHRGQFGITKDDFGRLYYNNNAIQILGDYVLPNSMINNPYQRPNEAINKILNEDQRVYPLHPTTVNRGYQKGILNEDSLLVAVTAACGPLVYRGDQFPGDYYQNYFVCEPQANLVKRHILDFKDIQTTSEHAWDDREFLASTDEGFRPVNLYNGPDGAMYVVDMHRGIVEYAAFSTPYYNNGIAAKKLDTLLHAGRILRIKHKDRELDEIPRLDNISPSGLVALLKSKKGWIRDRAQQLLIFKQDKSIVPELKATAQINDDAIAAIHALHTLNGLNELTFDFAHKIATSADPMVSAHAILLLRNHSANDNVMAMEELVTSLINRKDRIIDLYVSASLGPWVEISSKTFFPVLQEISQRYSGQGIYQEAIVNSLKGMEEEFEVLAKSNDKEDRDNLLTGILTKTMRNKQEGKMNSIYVEQKTVKNPRANGMALFRSTCATCHGIDGGGIEHLAPPLNTSQYIQGSSKKLAMIILHGLEGPIHIDGQRTNFNGSMPNFGNNFSDNEIADIISYLRNAFVMNRTGRVNAADVKELRSSWSGTLTEKDLLVMFD